MKPEDPVLLVICGPTASGKTELALRLARHFQTEIVSADSRQFYREIPIGTAQPTREEQSGIPHHFIASRSITEELNAGRFEAEALSLLEQLFRAHRIVILAGGSGLFIDALCKGLDELPQAQPEIREELNLRHRKEGLEPLREMLRKADPAYYSQVDLNNPQRVIRALEVYLAAGRPFSSYLKGETRKRPFRILKFAIELEREELYRRINQRVDQMIAQGLVEEARQVYAYRHLKSLETVGYSELFRYFDGELSLDEAVELIKRNTRRFAKRQITWFKRDPEVLWLKPAELESLPQRIASLC